MIKDFLAKLQNLVVGNIDLEDFVGAERDRAIYEKWVEVFNIMNPMNILGSLSTISNSIKMSKRDEIILLAYVKFFEQKISMLGSLPKDLTELFKKEKQQKKEGNEYDGTMFG